VPPLPFLPLCLCPVLDGLPLGRLVPQRHSAGEAAHHLQGGLGLVHGHHVARVVHAKKGQRPRPPRPGPTPAEAPEAAWKGRREAAMKSSWPDHPCHAPSASYLNHPDRREAQEWR